MSWSTFPPRFGMAANRWGLKSAPVSVSDRTWVQSWDGANSIITVVPGDFGGITAVQLFDSPTPDTLSHYGDIRNTAAAIQFTSNVIGALTPLPFVWDLGGEKMRLTKDGFLGILNTNPTCALSVAGVGQFTGNAFPTAGAGIELSYNGGFAGVAGYDRGANAYLPLFYTGSTHTWAIAGVSRMTMDATGNLNLLHGWFQATGPGAAAYETNIIIDNPHNAVGDFANLHYYSGAQILAGIEAYRAAATAGHIIFKNVSAGVYDESMRLDDSRRLGIGESVPTRRLTVNQNTTTGALTTPGAFLNRDPNDGCGTQVEFGQYGGTNVRFGGQYKAAVWGGWTAIIDAPAAVSFQIAQVEKVRIDSVGCITSKMVVRAEGNTAPGGGVGIGCEIGVAGGGFVQAYDRTNAVFASLTFFGSTYQFSGAGGVGINKVAGAGMMLDTDGGVRGGTFRNDQPASSGYYGLDQANGLQTIANGGTYDIPNFSGMILLSDPSVTGQTGIFICGAGVTTVVAQTGTIYANVAGPGKVSLTYVGGSGYRLTNNQGSSISFGIVTLRSRIAA